MDFNPRMLILARESRRMTQKTLAEASGTTQASVSRAEAGVHQPLPATVAAWARALRYPESFFTYRDQAPRLPRTFWRKQAKLGKADQKELEARIAIWCMNIQALVRSVDLPDPDVPGIRLGIDEKTAGDAARYMRAHWRVPNGPIEDVTNLVESFGIMVVMLPGTRGFQGVSIRDARKDLPPLIFVSADDPADRQRWTIAHELGHIVLHHHQQTLAETEEELELEADEFAGELLMPANEIRHQFTWKVDLAALAQLKLHWRTSMAALIRRGVRLERITERQAVRLWKLMSKYGYRRSEPNEFPPEEPTMLRELVRVHIEELGFSDEELATLLALDVEDVRVRFLSTSATPEEQRHEAKPKLRLVE